MIPPETPKRSCSKKTETRPPMAGTWRYLARLATYPPFMALALVFFVGLTLFYFLPLASGLIVRQVFNELSGAASAGFNLWTLFALLVGVAVLNQLAVTTAVTAETSMHIIIETLLRKNLLSRILEYPGARPLPGSTGEAISRLRDDVSDIPSLLTWIFDPLEQALVTLTGLAILARINAWLTLAVVIPLAVTVGLVSLAARRIQRYRRESHAAIAGVTGLLGELFGAVQAIKVAGTEAHVVAHLEGLNETRRKANLRDLVFTRFLESLNTNTASIGTGIVLLAAAQMLQAPGAAISVGDFSLFVSYLTYLNFMTTMFGNFLVLYHQVGVSFERLWAILPGAPPERLVEHGPVHLWGKLPVVEAVPAVEADRLETPDGTRAELPLPPFRGLPPERGLSPAGRRGGSEGRHFSYQPGHPPRLDHRDHRADRQRQNHPAARAAGAVAEGCRGNCLEWAAGRRPGQLFCPAAQRLHRPGAPPVQRVGQGQHPDGPAGDRAGAAAGHCCGSPRTRRASMARLGWRR